MMARAKCRTVRCQRMRKNRRSWRKPNPSQIRTPRHSTKKDKQRKAKNVGWRKSAKGKWYQERRQNRSDKNPRRKL